MNQASSSSSSQVPPPQLLAEIERISNIFNQAFASLDNTPTTANPITSDIIRIPYLSSNERVYYRNLFRTRRRVFDSLRLNPLIAKSTKDAASLMRAGNLFLYHDIKIEGELPGLCVGDVFMSKTEMTVVGLRALENDINDNVLMYGNFSNGQCVAICLILNEINDDVISVRKREKNKLALKMSMDYGFEVRVVRSLVYGGMEVYVYDGLYKVVDIWVKPKKNEVDDDVFKFRVVRVENQVESGSEIMRMALKLKISPLEIRPRGYISLDLSNQLERFPVLVCNKVDGDSDPLKYQYLVTSIFPSHVGIGSGTGCECAGGCADNCFCAMRNGDDGRFPYDHNGTLVRGKPLVFECGPNCQCPPTCRNRVTQKGTKYRFEVFRKKGGAWGVRSLDLILAGSFICEYAGTMLMREQEHLFTMNGGSLIYASQFAEKWKEWGDLSQLFNDYVCPAYPSIPPLDFAMDVSMRRNLACYISYTSTPNVFVQPVLYDHNSVHFPHLMLFALENIPPMRDLELNYLDNRVADEKPAIPNLVFG